MKKMRNKVPLERHKCNPSNINICLNFNEEYTVCHEKSLNHAASKSKTKGIQFDKTVIKLDDLHKG